MKTRLKPLFILSLPRAGSTMLQRLLAVHKDISTASEPWILLPYLYTLRKKGISAEFEYKMMVDAIDDFCLQLPNGADDYLAEIREFALRLYCKASDNGVKYFLDKTPRYHLIIEELMNLFPNGKFIFLWRNPLSVIASIIDTWREGKWEIDAYKIDLYRGLANLINAHNKYSLLACSVNYELLVNDPKNELARVFDYLDLHFDDQFINDYTSVLLTGRMGDTEGHRKYKTITKDPIEKWKHTINNPFRKVWCRRYLRWIGKDRLSSIGYDLLVLLKELDDVRFNQNAFLRDLMHIIKLNLKHLINQGQ